MPGLGRWEKNMIQTYFDFNWNIIMEALSTSINFKTDSQKQFIQKVKNHRMAMDILLVLSESLEKEILVPFIKHIKYVLGFDKIPENAKLWDLFQNYIKTEAVHPRYQYLLIMHRNALAIKLFRIGQRLNQPKLRMSAKEELSKLYFMNCNPTYCLIYAADKYQEKCRLEEHTEYLNETECFVRDLSRPLSAESHDYDFEEGTIQ